MLQPCHFAWPFLRAQRDPTVVACQIRIAELMRWIAFAVLCLVAIIGATSQALLSILIEPIKADLGISDTTIGLISGLAISVVGALAAFPIGAAADRYGRRRVLAASILTWSAATVLMGLANTTPGFTLGAVGINLGDAALLPLLYAMVPQIFTDRRSRDIANVWLVAVLMVGGYAVYALGGVLLHALEAGFLADLAPWRGLCLLVAFAGAVITLGLLLVPRGSQLTASAVKPGELLPGELLPGKLLDESFLVFLRREGGTIVLLFFALSFFYIAWLTCTFWIPSILQRAFGLSTAAANVWMGTPLMAASVAGLLLAGFLQRRLRDHWGDSAPIQMTLLGCVAGFIPVLALPFAATPYQFMLAYGLFTVAMTLCMSIAPAMLQACAPNRFRSRTIALFPIVVLWARIVMPWLVGSLSDKAGDAPRALLYINVGLLIVSLPVSVFMLKRLKPRYVALVVRVKAADGLA
jgi:MFS family permease